MSAANYIHVTHRDASNLMVVAPPYSSLAMLFLGIGVVCWIAGVVLSFVIRRKVAGMPKSFLWGVFPMLLFLVIGTPFVYVGFYNARATYLTIAADENQLRVQQNLLSIPIATRAYALNKVQKAVEGIGNSCVSLRAVMTDGGNVPLIGCTDRDGYNEVADSINRFLDAHRAPPQQ